MNIEGNFIREAIAKLMANALEYVLVQWEDESTIRIVSSNLSSKWFSSERIDINDIGSHKEVMKMKKHHQLISKAPSNVMFTLNNEGKPKAIYCSSQEINGDKQSIWMELPESNTSIQYLQNAVHDMKSPINSIIGVVNLMQHSFNEKPDLDELKMYLDLIKTTAHKSVSLVNEVMELAEMESPNYTLETEELALNEFIQMYINTHRLLTIRKKITIRFEHSKEYRVKINKVKMTRVFDNLISNAVKFSHVGSTIFVSLSEKDEKVVISIKDEGIGMPEMVQSQLFVKFGHAKRNGLDGETSSGLGLSIVKQIMELHDGTVRVESEDGKGTNVFLTLNKLSE